MNVLLADVEISFLRLLGFQILEHFLAQKLAELAQGGCMQVIRRRFFLLAHPCRRIDEYDHIIFIQVLGRFPRELTRTRNNAAVCCACICAEVRIGRIIENRSIVFTSPTPYIY